MDRRARTGTAHWSRRNLPALSQFIFTCATNQISTTVKGAFSMKFTVERDVLAEAVGWTARSLPLRPTSPVLNGLLITASAGEVSIASFDHETSARQVIAADVQSSPPMSP